MRCTKWAMVCAFAMCLSAPVVRAARDGFPPARVAVAKEVRKDAMGREYYLYRPKVLRKGRPYWLVVGAHIFGATGKHAGGFERLASLGNCIVVGPTFPRAYTSLDARSDTQVLALAASLKREFVLHDKIFLAGFSGGAQFAHRFALRHPKAVVGCAAISAGSWATGDAWKNDETVTAASAGVVFAIGCGTSDTGSTLTQSPLLWAQKFVAQLLARASLVKEVYWKGLGHRFDPRAQTLAAEALMMATTGRGLREGFALETQIDAAGTAAASLPYPQALAAIAKLGAKPATPPAKAHEATNAPPRQTRAHASGWYAPKAGFFATFARQRMAILRERLVRVVAARGAAEIRAMHNTRSAKDQARVRAIRALFAKHPRALAKINAAAK